MKYLIIIFFAFSLFLSNGHCGVTVTVMDDYIGGYPTKRKDKGKDRIDVKRDYEYKKSVVKFKNGGDVQFKVYTNYADNVGQDDSALGDLFLSTDGWNPDGVEGSGHKDDTAFNGETWEYAVVLDDHSSSIGGDLTMYRIDDQEDILLAEDVYGGARYRENQEVQVNTATAESMGIVGTWEIVDGKYIKFLFDYEGTIKDSVTKKGLGFHWTTTNANDVGEGFASSVAVPAPSTFALLSAGLLIMMCVKGRNDGWKLNSSNSRS